MIPVTIGIVSGLFVIISFIMLKQFDKKLMYGMILCGIGFLYVGYTWSDLRAVIFNSVQAVFFTFFAYYGVKKSLFILAAGYFAHGIWDILYHLFQDPGLIPPHYDLFCLSIDFTIGLYLLWLNYQIASKAAQLSPVPHV